MPLHCRSYNISVFSCIFLLYVNSLSAETDVCTQDNYYLIRHRQSGLVLDASGPVVLIKQVNGNPAQLWSFRCASKPGLFVIENKETGDVLDALEIKIQKIITQARDGSLYQEWSVNTDGSIVNAATNLYLDVHGRNFNEGNFVHLWQDNGEEGQRDVLDSLEIKNRQIITEACDGSLNQEWSVNSDGSIVNAAANLYLDVSGGDFTAGNYLHLWQDNGTPAQRFVLQKRRNIANLL